MKLERVVATVSDPAIIASEASAATSGIDGI